MYDSWQNRERLERIATAAMVAIISKHAPLVVTDEEGAETRKCVARGAVAYARDLIAELDKQA